VTIQTVSKIRIRKASPGESGRIEAFISPFVEDGKLLPRTLDELEDLIGTLFVAEFEGAMVGCAALDVYSSKLAEIRSLAVSPDVQGMGVGKLLVNACVELAQEKNILEVMAITEAEAFFKACGFDFTLTGERKALFFKTRD
jgi:N-acetylglutamate synthase-like GNAT family acetyltransferase